jgi:hypothetical protein
VRFVNDEARSFLARSPERFDLIQISLIDTWAATAAGAFVLSENTLYTTEAWELFWQKLTDDGVLSVSRWYTPPTPLEVYKLAALAVNALQRIGVEDPRSRLIVIATRRAKRGDACCGDVATLLLRRSPFEAADIRAIDEVAQKMGFEVLLSPDGATDDTFARLADARQIDAVLARFGQALIPPTDDRPFFFKMDSRLLTGLLQYVTVLSLVFVVAPVAVKAERRAIYRDVPASVAFMAIGLAFMLIEIALMQRLTLLLGHPTFSLSVVLAGLLVASGIGSYSTQRITVGAVREPPLRSRFIGLLVVLALLGIAAPAVVNRFYGAPTPIRIAVALLMILPAGFFMGMPFPIAMKISALRRPKLTAWLWGINGAASICAAVLAVMISSSSGISSAWWTGMACYALAAALIVRDAGSGTVDQPNP